MQIIDVHAHIYEKVAGITDGQPMSSDTLGRVDIGNRKVQFLPPAFEHSSSKADVLVAYMDWCGIEKAILMPNPYYGYHNHYFKESINQFPDRLKGVALVNILKGRKAADELAAIYDEGSLFGLKIEVDSTFQCAPGKRMTDQDLSPVWDCCSQYRQPVFLHLFRDCDVADFRKLAEEYPQIHFVICHMGADSCFGKGVSKDNFEEVLAVTKKHKNVSIDTSTVPVYFNEEYPYPSAVKVIEKAYQTVGPEKIMWASDYPGMLCHATMKQLINLVLNGCTHIPEGHKEMIMGENAARHFFN